MMTYDRDELNTELERDEGRKSFPYLDSEGIMTIGIGWNLKANGLPDHVIDILRDIAVDESERTLDGIYPEWRALGNVRQRVLVNMAYNLGSKKLRGFVKMWAAIKAGDYKTASEEMLVSKWAGQVGVRAKRLSKMMEEG